MSKRALIIAISNYPGDKALPGAAEDSKAWQKLLPAFGFTTIKILPDEHATKMEIIDRYKELLQSSDAELALIYLGHGTERDGEDGIVAYYTGNSPNQSEVILKSELLPITQSNLRQGVELTTIFDCCHAQGLSAPGLDRVKAGGGRKIRKARAQTDRIRFVAVGGKYGWRRAFRQTAAPAGVVELPEPLKLAATDANGAAYESMIGNVYRGLFSYSLITTVTDKPASTYDDAVGAAWDYVNPRHADQRPHISGPRRSNKFFE